MTESGDKRWQWGEQKDGHVEDEEDDDNDDATFDNDDYTFLTVLRGLLGAMC